MERYFRKIIIVAEITWVLIGSHVINILYFISILQATQTDGGQVYTYNISICANSPYGCAGACSGVNTAGVCQSWGPAPTSAKCFGKWDTAKLTGLSK